MHTKLAEVQLSLSCSKGQVSRETPDTHPQPTPNFMQFLFAFFWPANSVQSLHKNSTLWHLMNIITPWPEYTCTGGKMQKTPSCLHTQISSVGHHSISVPISNQPYTICSPVGSLQQNAKEQQTLDSKSGDLLYYLITSHLLEYVCFCKMGIKRILINTHQVVSRLQ